ncbi:MAG TPA: TetR/AcrR family transcriptional regulator [Clostridiaceae bacterium]|nr:TetR/AcrR family transcriptional regulator [Clostridiaceae bacterium]
MNKNKLSSATKHSLPHLSAQEQVKQARLRRDDRRTRRTIGALQNSLVKLLLKKPLREITVTELTESADISRTTFYLHYTDIDDLFSSLEDTIFKRFERIIHDTLIDSSMILHIKVDKTGNVQLPALYEVFKFIHDNTDLCIVLLTNPDSTFLSRIWLEGYTTLMNKAASTHDSKVNRSIEYYYYTVSSGVRGLIEHWLESGMKESVDEVYRLATDFILHNLTFLQRDFKHHF